MQQQNSISQNTAGSNQPMDSSLVTFNSQTRFPTPPPDEPKPEPQPAVASTQLQDLQEEPQPVLFDSDSKIVTGEQALQQETPILSSHLHSQTSQDVPAKHNLSLREEMK